MTGEDEDDPGPLFEYEQPRRLSWGTKLAKRLGLNRPRNDDLLGPFEHPKVVWKSALAFGALLGGILLLSEWWPPALWAKEYVRSKLWALPLLFLGFYVIHLVYECIIRVKSEELEAMRADPARPRERQRRRRKGGPPDHPRLPGI